MANNNQNKNQRFIRLVRDPQAVIVGGVRLPGNNHRINNEQIQQLLRQAPRPSQVLVPSSLLLPLPPQQPEGAAPPELEVLKIECETSDDWDMSANVFENDMVKSKSTDIEGSATFLREMILEHVILPNGKVSRKDMMNLRLVRKNWLQTTADSMRKFRHPMFMLTLDKKNSVSSTPNSQMENDGTGKLLDRFVRAMTSPTRLPNFIPPFCLKLTHDFFRKENYKDMSDCLISCGEAMTDFTLLFPTNNSLPFTFSSFSLPQLQRLAVQFSDRRITDSSAVNQIDVHTTCPLQIILNGTDELKELTFMMTITGTPIPFGFEYLVLPKTISSLCMDSRVKESDLHLLINNDLPNLSNLRLLAAMEPYSGETIFQILDKLRGNLRTLHLNGYNYPGRVPTLFKFPVMAKLKTLTVTSCCWDFIEGLESLESQLPKMSELRILDTKEAMFSKWTDNSKFETVQTLVVSLMNEVPVTLTMGKMVYLHLAFPNIVNLKITMCGPLSCGLKYLFTEMWSLEKLAIAVKWSGEYFSPGHWDSVLVGMPLEMATVFRNNPDYMKMVDLKDDNEFPSIRRLTALKSLALEDNISRAAPVNQPLITDLAFYFAFLKMPSLSNLHLNGRFSQSKQMTERWKQEKGTEIHEFIYTSDLFY